MTAWTLTDPQTSAVYVMHNNPDRMTSPFPRKDLQHTRGNRDDVHVARSLLRRKTPTQWTWEGVIRSQEHYDALLLWSRKPYAIEVSDHLGRTWLVVIQKFAANDRRPTAKAPIRQRYVMETLILGEVIP